MSRLSGSEALKLRIEELELLQKSQIDDLKNSTRNMLDSISPGQLIKNSIEDIVRSKDVRHRTSEAALGIGAGLLAKKLIVRRSKNIFRKILGSAVQFFLTIFINKKISRARQAKLIGYYHRA